MWDWYIYFFSCSILIGILKLHQSHIKDLAAFLLQPLKIFTYSKNRLFLELLIICEEKNLSLISFERCHFDYNFSNSYLFIHVFYFLVSLVIKFFYRVTIRFKKVLAEVVQNTSSYIFSVFLYFQLCPFLLFINLTNIVYWYLFTLSGLLYTIFIKLVSIQFFFKKWLLVLLKCSIFSLFYFINLCNYYSYLLHS